jgi:NhaC family Na+:H+ antiporter
MIGKKERTAERKPSLAISVVPVAILLAVLLTLLITRGADSISEYSSMTLLGSAMVSLVLATITRSYTWERLRDGFRRSATQILPAVPLLLLIALIATTWMFSGVVPLLIDYGLRILNPRFFLVITCLVCAFISVLTGSSWTTIATIGVAFMGIGEVMGFGAGWVAGAIISGAYFGDKVSPLSDTTVIASSSCGVDLFEHIRNMMYTSGPAMLIALIVFALDGFLTPARDFNVADCQLLGALETSFNLSLWLLVIPVLTGILIARKLNTLLTLAISSALGMAGIFLFQPQLIPQIAPNGIVVMLWSETAMRTGMEQIDSLLTTGGILGMLPTIELILCAMTFGGAMLGTGMLRTIANTFTHRLKHRRSIVGATVASGLFLNATTADQYLSIIIGSNMYRDVYRDFKLPGKLLSRTLEDSISVTSVLFPWNSCGVTQSTVLSVSTLTYLPYCIFNYLSPVMTLIATIPFRRKKISETVCEAYDNGRR